MRKLNFKGYKTTSLRSDKFYDWLFDKVLENRSKRQLTTSTDKIYDVDNSKTPPQGGTI